MDPNFRPMTCSVVSTTDGHISASPIIWLDKGNITINQMLDNLLPYMLCPVQPEQVKSFETSVVKQKWSNSSIILLSLKMGKKPRYESMVENWISQVLSGKFCQNSVKIASLENSVSKARVLRIVWILLLVDISEYQTCANVPKQEVELSTSSQRYHVKDLFQEDST